MIADAHMRPPASTGWGDGAMVAPDPAGCVLAAIRAAIAAIDDTTSTSEWRVHAARRAVKNARSLALVFREAAPGMAKAVRRELHAAMHGLAGIRDTDAVRATALQLGADVGSSLWPGRRTYVRAAIGASRRHVLAAEAEARMLAGIVLPPGAVADVLETARQAVLRASGRARRKPTASARHAWRKRIKDYASLRALVVTTGDGKTESLITELAELLGRERDLRSLGHHLDRAGANGAGTRRRIRRKRNKLQRLALGIGRRLDRTLRAEGRRARLAASSS